eukprot:CAMPEP_0118800224 /NCGR_PEP_ID=MMETSP1161-20130426/2201_1 /TAXON_ID=249345 /ORGANISM="Picochlorum oklahomensis, Strain CCMP2329" /LENGTH=726 /DNA_ID=CAMNT_0006728037 /DNA_START=1078 /DNA_END=3258 /DNA_ORIENTATION=+
MTNHSHGDIGDLGKMVGWRILSDKVEYHFTIDDDILYPPNYVINMISKIKSQNDTAVVGVHGMSFKYPLDDLFDLKNRHGYNFHLGLDHDTPVHLLGTGCMAFKSSALNGAHYEDWIPNMLDAWISKHALKNKIPLISIARQPFWLVPIRMHSTESLWERTSSGALDTMFYQHYLMSSDSFTFTRRKNYPKVIMAVTTFNRVFFLKKFIESWETTRSVDLDWVLIIADDGSTDGTIDYIENLKLHRTEIKLIKCNRVYVCGMVNKIFKLAEQIEFDYLFKADDDIIFTKNGWDQLYINAIVKSGYDHLCYFNKKHYIDLARRQNLEPLGTCILDDNAIIEGCAPATRAMGALFTITPRVIKTVGYCDELNFKFRGQWHQDLSARMTRANFNNFNSFFDAAGSNDYIKLQGIDDDQEYKSAMEYGKEYKYTKDPEVVKMREQLINDQNRIFVPFESENTTRFLQNIIVINGRTLMRRWLSLKSKIEMLGYKAIRLEAIFPGTPEVDLLQKKYESAWEIAWQKYGRSKFPSSSKSFYLGDLPMEARMVQWENCHSRRSLMQTSLAYMLSYKKSVEFAMTHDMESVLILDDDVLIHRDFSHLIKSLEEQLPSSFKLVYLGAFQYDWDGWITRISKNLYRGHGSGVASHAVLLHKSVFLELIALFNKPLLPVDDGAISYLCRKYTSDCLTAIPNLFIQDLKKNSTINSGISDLSLKKKFDSFRWNVSEYY